MLRLRTLKFTMLHLRTNRVGYLYPSGSPTEVSVGDTKTITLGILLDFIMAQNVFVNADLESYVLIIFLLRLGVIL